MASSDYSLSNIFALYKASSAYKTLRESGVIGVITNYQNLRHFGFHCHAVFTATAADHQLLDLIKQRRPSHLVKHVLYSLMYIKEGLVYEKNTGAVVGFSDLVKRNTWLLETSSKWQKQ